MNTLHRLWCHIVHDRCADRPEEPIDDIDHTETNAALHRSSQVETSMRLQTGLLKRQSSRLKQALESGDDDELSRVTAAMRRPAGAMWMEEALTRREGG